MEQIDLRCQLEYLMKARAEAVSRYERLLLSLQPPRPCRPDTLENHYRRVPAKSAVGLPNFTFSYATTGANDSSAYSTSSADSEGSRPPLAGEDLQSCPSANLLPCLQACAQAVLGLSSSIDKATSEWQSHQTYARDEFWSSYYRTGHVMRELTNNEPKSPFERTTAQTHTHRRSAAQIVGASPHADRVPVMAEPVLCPAPNESHGSPRHGHKRSTSVLDTRSIWGQGALSRSLTNDTRSTHQTTHSAQQVNADVAGPSHDVSKTSPPVQVTEPLESAPALIRRLSGRARSTLRRRADTSHSGVIRDRSLGPVLVRRINAPLLNTTTFPTSSLRIPVRKRCWKWRLPQAVRLLLSQKRWVRDVESPMPSNGPRSWRDRR